jgi:hypothetical protein
VKRLTFALVANSYVPHSPKRQLHLHGPCLIRRQFERFRCLGEWQGGGDQRLDVDQTGAHQLDGEGEFLVEAKGAAQLEFLGDEGVDRQGEGAAGVWVSGAHNY